MLCVSRSCVSFYTALCVLSVSRKKRENLSIWKAVYCTTSSVPLSWFLFGFGSCLNLPGVMNDALHCASSRWPRVSHSWCIIFQVVSGWPAVASRTCSRHELFELAAGKSHRWSYYWYWENIMSCMAGYVCVILKRKQPTNKKLYTWSWYTIV